MAFDWGELFNTVVGGLTGGGGSSGGGTTGGSSGTSLTGIADLLNAIRGIAGGGLSAAAAKELADKQGAAFDALRTGATRPVTSTGSNGTTGNFTNGSLTLGVGDQLGALQTLFNNVNKGALEGAQTSQATGGLTAEQKALQDLFTSAGTKAATSLSTGAGATDAFNSTLSALRARSADAEARATAENFARQQRTGQLGTTGGALQTEAFAKGLGMADLERQLAAGAESRAAGNYDLGIATGANANQANLATQGQQSIAQQLQTALQALTGSTAISDEARKDMQLAIGANQSSNAALGQLASASTNANFNPAGDLDALAGLLTGGGTNAGGTAGGGNGLLDQLGDLLGDLFGGGAAAGTLTPGNAAEADAAAQDTSGVNNANEADLGNIQQPSIVDVLGPLAGAGAGAAAGTTPAGTSTITEQPEVGAEPTQTANQTPSAASPASSIGSALGTAGAAGLGSVLAGAAAPAGTATITELGGQLANQIGQAGAAAAGGTTAAAGGAASTAASGAQAGASGSSSTIGAAGTALAIAGALYGGYNTYQAAAAGDKGSAAMNGAATGAAIGSVIPVVGTAVGAVVGALVGVVGASFGDKDKASEAAYGSYKDIPADQNIRSWSDTQVGGAVFESIKSHTKSGNAKRFEDVGDAYRAFGISDNNYKGFQTTMGSFIEGVIKTAQEAGGLPKDPAELAKLDGQQIYYKIVRPAMAAKIEETQGKSATTNSWSKDISSNPGAFQGILADLTDYMIGGGDKNPYKPAAEPKKTTMPVTGRNGIKAALRDL